MIRETRYFYAFVMLALSHLMRANDVPNFSVTYIALMGVMFFIIALWKGDAK